MKFYRCDCCGKEISDGAIAVRLPIYIDCDGVAAIKRDGRAMDFCTDCGWALAEWYYKECKKHNRTGIKAINMNDDWEEF